MAQLSTLNVLPTLPAEIVYMILKEYYIDLHEDTMGLHLNRPPRNLPSRAGSNPMLVCKMFQAICRPLHNSHISGLVFGDDITHKSHLKKVLAHYDKYRRLRKYVKRLDITVHWEFSANVVQTYMDHLSRRFPRVEFISIQMWHEDGVTPVAIMHQNADMAMVEYGHVFDDSLYNFPSLRTVHLIGFEEVDIECAIGMPNLQELRFINCGYVDKLQGSTSAISNITSLSVLHDPDCFGSLFHLLSLKATPMLEELVINLNYCLLLDDVSDSIHLPKLKRLHIHVVDESDLDDILDALYNGAHEAGAQPFKELRDLRVGCQEGKLSVEKIERLIANAQLDKFALTSGESGLGILDHLNF
ncbi:hypothetical protein CVT24_001239 [Panaeolus cyanescens]|uniref:Uncharacterized protein n=1 Tax=Panaeolus cyanescens TaxID=181874 RepID=A0A409YZ79_9AGAR|nr:hypothetical protein CVT24_001239 [Panaeolus cyanescens]